ncbi:unnamed protein product [Ilex paraguariensis]|uniref:Uncharacterized protein n=1 Tax=Ilex paraguariensis TaxID=185542 RepID=A0ABC8URA9_9AQUA
MAMRSVVSRISFRRFMETSRKSTSAGLRYFSDGKGRILSEEERAKETVYIHVLPLSLSSDAFMMFSNSYQIYCVTYDYTMDGYDGKNTHLTIFPSHSILKP